MWTWTWCNLQHRLRHTSRRRSEEIKGLKRYRNTRHSFFITNPIATKPWMTINTYLPIARRYSTRSHADKYWPHPLTEWMRYRDWLCGVELSIRKEAKVPKGEITTTTTQLGIATLATIIVGSVYWLAGKLYDVPKASVSVSDACRSVLPLSKLQVNITLTFNRNVHPAINCNKLQFLLSVSYLLDFQCSFEVFRFPLNIAGCGKKWLSLIEWALLVQLTACQTYILFFCCWLKNKAKKWHNKKIQIAIWWLVEGPSSFKG